MFSHSYKVAFALALRLANMAKGIRSFIRSMKHILMGRGLCRKWSFVVLLTECG